MISASLFSSEILERLLCVAGILLFFVFARVFRRLIMGRRRPMPVRVPWRYSLASITVLVVLSSIVFWLCRIDTESSFLLGLLLLATWFAGCRFLELRRALAERRQKTFEESIKAVTTTPPREAARGSSE